ncbi:MAG: hypothetical protein C0494_03125 [Sphingobium sp.]|nr:hypothetical protein [Sphingobium sp.]
MEISEFWFVVLLAVAPFCVVQAVRDIRTKNYVWGAAAAIAAALILAMPIKTHAVKIDLPANR